MEKNASIEKGIQVLQALNIPPYMFKISDICAKTGLNRTIVYRILATYEAYDIVTRDDATGRYKVGPGLYQLGIKFIINSNYRGQMEKLLDEIAGITKESVGMAVKEKDKIISVLEIEIHQPMKMNDVPGKYCSPNKGNYGKCITAFQDAETLEALFKNNSFEKTFPNVLTTREELLEEFRLIRQRGYSTSVDELGIDILGVGIPLRNPMGQVTACVACAYFRQEGDNEQKKMDEIRDVLLSYQARLEQCLA